MPDANQTPCPTCGGSGHLPVNAAPPIEKSAERIRMLMDDREWTQTQLANSIGRTQAAVSYWVTGKRRPGYDDLCLLADLFGVTTDYLIGRDA